MGNGRNEAGPVKDSYIFKLEDMAPLLHGLWVHISSWTWANKVGGVHAHRCLECKHLVICTCLPRSQYDLAGCPWCRWPWALVWKLRARPGPKRKGKTSKRARRSRQPVA